MGYTQLPSEPDAQDIDRWLIENHISNYAELVLATAGNSRIIRVVHDFCEHYSLLCDGIAKLDERKAAETVNQAVAVENALDVTDSEDEEGAEDERSIIMEARRSAALANQKVAELEKHVAELEQNQTEMEAENHQLNRIVEEQKKLIERVIHERDRAQSKLQKIADAKDKNKKVIVTFVEPTKSDSGESNGADAPVGEATDSYHREPASGE